uniref:CN hydrolase domain-containing protein n=1 Tax=Angiostrongylus cantonensis TaxID=6313 RepID=A0A0K0D0F9_ANGCA
MVTICTYKAPTLASESSIEDLLMQARMIRYDVISLAETRRHHPFNAVYDNGEEPFLGTCDCRGVGGFGVLVNTGFIGDFNAKIGPIRTSEDRHIGTHGLEWNEQGERLSEFIMATKTIQVTQVDCLPYSLRRLNVDPASFNTPFFDRIGI